VSIGANISVIAVGAILSFATHLRTTGFSLIAMGGVLMAVGAVGLFMQVAALHRQRQLTVAQDDPAVRVRDGAPAVGLLTRALPGLRRLGWTGLSAALAASASSAADGVQEYDDHARRGQAEAGYGKAAALAAGSNAFWRRSRRNWPATAGSTSGCGTCGCRAG